MKNASFLRTNILLIFIVSISVQRDSRSYVLKHLNIPLTNAIYGIDVSNHQGDIAWQKVKQWKDKMIDFAYIKATEGATHNDIRYKKNVEGAIKAGIRVGSYHYFRTTSSPESQFEHFKEIVDISKQILIPLIDVEEMNNWDQVTFHKRFQKFLDLVEEHFGKKPMIYTVNSFYNKNLSGKYKDYHFMIGRYGKNQPFMKDDHVWTIWQFTDEATLEGIPKPVDIDVLNPEIKIEELLLDAKP